MSGLTAMMEIAEAMGVDTLKLTEESILTSQQLVVSRMVRLLIMSEFASGVDKLEPGQVEADVLGAVRRMNTKGLISFEKLIPGLLRALTEAYEVFEKAGSEAFLLLYEKYPRRTDDGTE